MDCITEHLPQDMLYGQILTEGKITRSKLYIDEFISLEYDHNRTRKIIDDFIDDYEVRGLKTYLYQLYILSNLDKPNGIFAGLKFSLSKANRMSFYEHRRQVNQMIKYGESWIRKTEGSNFTVNVEITEVVKEIESEAVQDIQEIQRVYIQTEKEDTNETFIDYVLRKLEKEQVVGAVGDILGLIIRGIRGIFSMVGSIIEIAGPALAAIAAVAFVIIQIIKFMFDIGSGIAGMIF